MREHPVSISLIVQTWKLKVSQTDKIVLLYLADRANEHGICWPSVGTIATAASLSDRAVQNAIKRLTQSGHISTYWSKPTRTGTRASEKAGRGVRHFRVHPRATFTSEQEARANELQFSTEFGSTPPRNSVHLSPEPSSPKSPMKPNRTFNEALPPPAPQRGTDGDLADWLICEWNTMARAISLQRAYRINGRAVAKLEAEFSRNEIVCALNSIPRSPLLRGERGDWSGATLDWFIKPANVSKILNGAFSAGPAFNTGNPEKDAILLEMWEVNRTLKNPYVIAAKTRQLERRLATLDGIGAETNDDRDW